MQTIWYEDFTSPVSLTSGDPTKTNVQSGKLVSSNDEAVWTSQPIALSGYTDVKIAVDLSSSGGVEDNDYLRVYYKLDGGAETPLLNGWWVGDVEPATAMIGDLSGSSVQIIVKFKTDDAAEQYAIDNARVYTEPSGHYAIKNGNWNDPNTWSYTSGGLSCSCVPDPLSDTYVGGYTVNMSASGYTNNLTIQNSSGLLWIVDNVDLILYGNATLDVKNGGTVSATDGSNIIFTQWNSRKLESDLVRVGAGSGGVEAVVNIDSPTGVQLFELELNATGNYTIQGTGNLLLTDDLDINNEATVTNALTGELTINRSLQIDFSGITFTNEGNIVVGENLVYEQSNSHINNNGSITTQFLRLESAAVNGSSLTNESNGNISVIRDTYLANNEFTIDNEGNLELAGNIQSVEQGEVLFYNRTGAVWKLGGSFISDDIFLFASEANNEVHYDGATDQLMFTPRDVNNAFQPGPYWHLTVSNKNTNAGSPSISRKTFALPGLDINGNVTIVGTPGGRVAFQAAPGRNVFVAGDWEQQEDANAMNDAQFGEGNGTETVTFDGTADQYIRSNETFNNLTIDKSTGSVTVLDKIRVKRKVRFVKGIVKVNGSTPLTFENNAIVVAVSNESHVQGAVTRQGSAGSDFTFPIGDGARYRPLSLSGLNVASDFTVEYHRANPTDDGYALTSVSSPLLNVSGCEYWEVERTGAAEAFVTLTWDEAGCPTDINDLTIVRWDGSQWVAVPSVATGTASSGSITSSARLSAFGIFTLTERNDVPQAVDDDAITQEGISIEINVPQNDTDRNGIDPITVSVVVAAQHGAVSVNPATGVVTYVPNVNFAGKDSLRYTISDIKGLASNEATVVIVVGAVNTAPLAQPDAYLTDEDQELTGNLASNDTDQDSNTLVLTLDPNHLPAHGDLTINPDGTFIYTPDTNFFGNDQFAYQLCDDGNPALCDTALVTINVLPVNDAPVAADDAFTGVESETIVANVATNDADPENNPLGNVSLLTAPANGSVTLESSGRFTYEPDRYYVGTDQFTYRICDDQNPSLCDEAQVTIQVQAGQLKVPKAFSPNQDQTNDVWIISGIRAYPNNTVTVFNRWGNAVYRARGYDNQTTQWQGKASQGITLGNHPLPEGTYFYVIDLGEGQKPMSGYVLLKR